MMDDQIASRAYFHRGTSQIRRAAERMIIERDGIVLAVIRHMVNAPDLSPEDIGRDRLVCITRLGEPFVTWLLDGQPIVRFWEPEGRTGLGGEPLVFNQRYQVLV
jgi:hypothetical protein